VEDGHWESMAVVTEDGKKILDENGGRVWAAFIWLHNRDFWRTVHSCIYIYIYIYTSLYNHSIYTFQDTAEIHKMYF
jgi:hypothetical protein